jgi:hypothetical protein
VRKVIRVCKQPVNDLLASPVSVRRAQSYIPSLGFLGMSTTAINISMQQAAVYSSDDTSSCTGDGGTSARTKQTVEFCKRKVKLSP